MNYKNVSTKPERYQAAKKDLKMKKWKFTYLGIKGIAERYNDENGIYVLWYGMGFHFIAACNRLKKAILLQEK